MSALDDYVARVAAENENVFSRAMLDGKEVSLVWLRHKVARRAFQEIHPNVFVHGAAPPTFRQRARAALLAAGDGAGASHASQAFLEGVAGAEEPDEVEITVPDDRHLSLVGVRVYRSRRALEKKRWVDGIRVTSIERMLIDYAGVATSLQVEDAVEDVLNRRLSAEIRLWEGLAKFGGRGVTGTRRLRHVLAHRPKGRPAKSLLEILLGHVLVAHHLGGIRNHPVVVGGKKYELDRAWLEEMVCVEADSKRWHSTATASKRDAAKQAACEAAGWFFVRTDWDEVVNRPAQLVARLRAALAERRPSHPTVA